MAAALLALALLGCKHVPEVVRPPRAPTESDDRTKIHLRDGNVLVCDKWSFKDGAFSGEGDTYDLDRHLLQHGRFYVAASDVALLETSKATLGAEELALGFVTVASLTLTAACAAKPKACFGSCPTFYVPSKDGWTIQAEGFSGSIASSLEADDVDDLPDAVPDHGLVTLAMRNEALETHVVRRLRLLVVDGPHGSFVARRPSGKFDALGTLAPPREAVWEGTDVRGLLTDRDGAELSPPSDGKDLASKTSVAMTFDPPHARRAGLVLTVRNSLMSTFVLYQMVGLYGRKAGALLTAAEHFDLRTLVGLRGFATALGGIDVRYRQGGESGGAQRPSATPVPSPA